MSYVFFNGKILDEKSVSIPLDDRGFHYGDGVFTTVRVKEGTPEYLDLHFERLKEGCRELNILPPTIDPSWFSSLIEANQAKEGVWRMKVILTGGGTELDYLRPREVKTFLITLIPYHPPKKSPVNLLKYIYNNNSRLLKIKSLAYLERLQLRTLAKQQGKDDVLLLSPEGYILEASFSNLIWKVDGQWETPDPSLPILEGVYLKAMSQTHSLSYVKKKLDDLPKQTEFYSCNCMTGLLPCLI